MKKARILQGKSPGKEGLLVFAIIVSGFASNKKHNMPKMQEILTKTVMLLQYSDHGSYMSKVFSDDERTRFL
jgi:hypothetical protein